MAKMKDRNAQLKTALGAMAPKERIKEAQNLPSYDAKNRQGLDAYSLSDELRLISMLNVLKLEPQYYRSENTTMTELRDLIEKLAIKDPYFVAQCIAWSRNLGEGMRSINHLAAALLAPFACGEEWAKRFYGPFNKSTKSGGCIFRPDDMKEIKDVYSALNKSPLTNAMKKGFASAIESYDTYLLGKYRKTIIDISNLSHPNSKNSKAWVTIDGKQMKALDAIMQGITVSADTWEVAQTEAGQEVSKAVKEGKLTADEAKEVLKEAKNDNWESLLKEGKLGILAALRNIRNMLKNPRPEVIKMLCDLLSDEERIRESKVMPYQIDMAYEVIKQEFPTNSSTVPVVNALTRGYELSIPNLAEALPGRTCVMVDCSGSMWSPCRIATKAIRSTCADKAGLIAATIAKAVNADVIRFGTKAQYVEYTPQQNVFQLAHKIAAYDMGGTSISSAFELIMKTRKKYDRIIILSDNECNAKSWYSNKWTEEIYKDYIRTVCSPYVYAVDLAAYGTVPVAGDKVNYYFGYGYTFFDDISSKEFNPSQHIDKIKNYVI